MRDGPLEPTRGRSYPRSGSKAATPLPSRQHRRRRGALPVKHWTAQHANHAIALGLRWTFVVPGQSRLWIEVDGRRVLDIPGGAIDLGDRIAGTVDLSGERVEIEGLIGLDGFRHRGQIRVDGVRVGGDASLGRLERSALQQAVSGGHLRGVARQALVFGLPFGAAMAALAAQDADAGLARLARVAAVSGGIYGLGIGAMWHLLHVRALVRLYPPGT